MENFLKELGINKEFTKQGDKLVISLEDSNEFSKMYTLLDKSPLVDLDVENIELTSELNTLVYLGDEFDITLKADFKDDVYLLEIARGE